MKIGTPQQFILALVLLIQIGCRCVYGQTRVSGKVSDESGIAIPNANIAIILENNTISTFTFSDPDGGFTLQATSSIDSLTIKATRLGFDAALLRIANKTQTVQLVLKESALKLREVTVKAPPVIMRKDTIDYQVSAFKSESDRTISDVIKRMPGIEVQENGQILYQGNPIGKYYINGLDLLEGRYNLANDNLPADAVRKVQVMENDQPIKILKSKVLSEKASLNIQLKKFTTTGTGKVAAGVSPALWDVNVTPMIFHRSFQMIASMQSNNAGTALSRQIEVLTKSSQTNLPTPLLSIQPSSPPTISSERWLDNRSHLGSFNFIKKTKDQTELKLGLGLRDEMQQQAGRNYTRFLTPGSVIEIDERIRNQANTRALVASFVVEKNTDHIFIKNNASGHFGQLRGFGSLTGTLPGIQQNLATEQTQLQNTLTMITQAGKQLFNINSQTFYNKQPELLLVRPGVFSALFNADNNFKSTAQNVLTTEFNTKNSIGFTRKISAISITPKAGLNFLHHGFKSTIDNGPGDSISIRDDAFRNDLIYTHFTSFAELGAYYESKKWNVELNLPFRMHTFEISNFVQSRVQKQNRPAFEPSLTARYRLTDYTDFTSQVSYSYDFGQPAQVYSGFILKSYRNIQRTNGAIPLNRILMGSVGINYKNPLSLTFVNFTTSVLRIKNNLQYRTDIDSTGAAELTYVLNDNVQLSKNVRLGVGKYFGEIKTSLKFNGDASFISSEQIVTEREVAVRNQIYRVGLSASTLFSTYIGVELSGDVNFFNTGIDNQRISTTGTTQLRLGIDIYPTQAHAFRLDTEQYASRGSDHQNQFYLHLRYRYTFGKRKIDLEIRGNNLTNAQNYISILNSAFTVAESSFRLRPRQILVGFRIPF